MDPTPFNAFFSHLGFVEDPFQSTNASDEPHIHEYFIAPPYFASVLGNPTQPKSQVILAPRGGGKTPHRIMVEQDAARKRTYLCITYDHFDSHFDTGTLSTNLDRHLIEIRKYILIALLLDMADKPGATLLLDRLERALLRSEIHSWMNQFSSVSFHNTIKSLSSWREKASDIWTKYGGQLSSLINAFAARYDIGPINLGTPAVADSTDIASARYHIARQVEIAKKLGYESIYVLVDRIDETTWTNQDAEASFQLVRPIVTDLQTLETPGIAFKFFLWDQIREKYFTAGARPDRVKVFELRWNVNELERMLSQRLRSFSNGAITSLNEMCVNDKRFDAHRLVAHMGAGSPRDVIRVCGRIVDEHTRTSVEERPITADSVLRGIRVFCEERSAELYGPYMEQIRRVGHPTFTISHIASDVFRVTAQAARQKIGQWVNIGACSKIDEVDNPGARPLHLYGLTDPRLVLACVPRDDLELAIGNYMFLCNECEAVAISDRDEVICGACGARTSLEGAMSVLRHCSF